MAGSPYRRFPDVRFEPLEAPPVIEREDVPVVETEEIAAPVRPPEEPVGIPERVEMRREREGAKTN